MDNSLVKVQKDANTFLTVGNELLGKAKQLSIVKTEDVQVATSILKECQQTEKELESKRLEITKPLNDFIGEVNVLFRGTAVPILEAKNEVKTKIVSYNQEQERIKREEEARLLAEERARLQKLEEERIERERLEAQKRAEEERKLAIERERLRKLEEERIAKEMEARKASDEEQRKAREEADRQRMEREKLENERLELDRQKREVEEEKRRQEEQRVIDEQKRVEADLLAKKQAELRVKGIVKRWAWEIVEENKVPRAFCTSDSKKIAEAVKAGVRQIEGVRIFVSESVR